MSRKAILRALEEHGPLTAARLADLCHEDSSYIARSAAVLRQLGRVIRIDSGHGRGSVAIYALAGTTKHNPETLAKAKMMRGYFRATTGSDPAHPGVPSPRDPCWRCGVRGDLGCKHKAAAI